MLLCKKIFFIVIGTLIASYGIELVVHAGFGSGTYGVLCTGMEISFHITFGQASLISGLVMVVISLIFDKEQIYWGTIIYQIVYSIFTDFFSNYLYYTNNQIINFFIMIFGIILFGIGTGIYSYVNWGKGPYESITFLFVNKFNWQIQYVRMAQDAITVLIGYLLKGSVGLSTICFVLICGKVIQYTINIIKKYNLIKI